MVGEERRGAEGVRSSLPPMKLIYTIPGSKGGFVDRVLTGYFPSLVI
jgi:hypothetical protein